ncbi:phosphoenolpyruvate carboxykinase (ATP) [Anoxybacillus rupiensis]|jgi:phosphoenolpyruvate carboxykinase (ATP)|uniref:Phosphoenolpyruvate carboxykinase (ATP) n=1 Tax=Anoxybacteroides rupiense TaxID=311460 RepID=A0ABD5ITW3_9BACL|nr:MULTISPECIES: phosphoenolpyruvate carboxykinase (ATP) [Anoxybacillus]MBB3906980.1 phosphoenolpyruvate carboxykinase (ATP) [Anoxybacillus rupiensis]MBS2771492.1 phosphoenolpyruvate carboxykinase (ATP) [Anoxybacillus rupiensis]MDE8564664.1 phosphoenolpyruvate carboxykinase (ATP) [Anoxybacillus rupiensis]MED5051234.1 phosphoenolpyruvate carboxykinase (ATP) [Anoxybacillus rupiensis]QHC05137.1 phosphoenolpyruvate carboxykinase (ATP) [Anoxybacillus sp. PDR2]
MSIVDVTNKLNILLQRQNIQQNLSVSQLVEKVLERKEGMLTATGAVATTTGKYTGRSPKDKYIVAEASTKEKIDWGTVNQPISEEVFDQLYHKVIDYLMQKDEIFVFKGFAGADPAYRLPIQVINEFAWHNLFAHQLFIRPTQEELETHDAQFTVISAPNFKADPAVDGTKSETFIIISFERRIVLIGGTEYAGEIKKSIFSVMNFLLPEQNILPMHCSANVGPEGDVALFFGLSGTGKTTLSADPKRRLIGDDEHGWSNSGVFNIEGGCYAKCINLSREKEPQIFDAIRFGAVLENVVLDENTRIPDYDNATLTENTRAAYPIQSIDNIVDPSVAGHPATIVFLTADAFGVLPPISKLTKEQAMYHFLSGYTSKLAGTERGITSPQATFSTCFGAPFLPLPATRYAEMLGKKIDEHQVQVFLVNTGWTGGEYGVGSRMKLQYTRAMVQAALEGELNNVETVQDPIFGLQIPAHVPGVPDEVLLPKNTWADQEAYEQKAKDLAAKFRENFKKFTNVDPSIEKLGGPIA